MNKNTYLPLALSGVLALSGCATPNRAVNVATPEYRSPASQAYYAEQEAREKKKNKNRGGEFVGRFIGEGLLRLLFPF